MSAEENVIHAEDPTVQEAVEVVEPARPVRPVSHAPAPRASDAVFIPYTDRLLLENLQLKLQNIDQQRNLLKAQDDNLSFQHQGLMVEYTKHLTSLSEQYGFDPTTSRMLPETGQIVPNGLPNQLRR